MAIHRPLHSSILRPVYSPIVRPGTPWGGVGGGAAAPAAWSPAQLGSKLTLDLRAGPTVTQVAGPKVNPWVDSSTLVHDFSQAMDAARPLVTTMNGLTCPEFTGTQNLMCAALGSTFLSVASYEFWVVANIDVMGTGGILIGDSGGTEWLVRCVSTGVQARCADAGGLDSTNAITLMPGTTYMVGVRYDGTTITLDAAGTTETVLSGNLAALANGVLVGSGVDGDIGAAVTCNAILTAPERTLLKAYFATTYGAV